MKEIQFKKSTNLQIIENKDEYIFKKGVIHTTEIIIDKTGKKGILHLPDRMYYSGIPLTSAIPFVSGLQKSVCQQATLNQYPLL